MPRKNGKLTPQERAFVKAMAGTGDATYAAVKAGYATPALKGSLKSKVLAAEIRAEQQRRLFTEVLPLAVDQHIAMLRDDRTPAGAKGALIATAYKHALAPEADDTGLELHAMDAAQLGNRIAELQNRLSDLARPVLDLEANPPEGGVFD
jgi:hypothetical protein